MEKRTNLPAMVLTGLLTALVFLSGSIVKIPTFGGGYVHIGDCMVMVSAALLGKKKGAFAAGAGMTLVDVLGGYPLWAPFTLVIKAAMAFFAALILERLGKRSVPAFLAAFSVAGVAMVFGYFFAGAVMALFLTKDAMGPWAALAFAANDILANVLQAAVGIAAGAPLCVLMEKLLASFRKPS